MTKIYTVKDLISFFIDEIVLSAFTALFYKKSYDYEYWLNITNILVLTVLRFKLSSTCSMAFSRWIVSSWSISFLDANSNSSNWIL